MPHVLLIVPFVEILALASFAAINRTSAEYLLSVLPALLIGLIVVWIAFREGQWLQGRRILAVSLLVAIIFVAGFQMLGFIFPGLAKDVEPWSIGNAERLATVGAVAFLGHMILFALVACIERWRRKSGS